MVMSKPLACSSLPIDDEIIPLPSEEATPPVTKMYLVSATILILFKMIILYGVQIYYFLSRNAKFCLSFVAVCGGAQRSLYKEIAVMLSSPNNFFF